MISAAVTLSLGAFLGVPQQDAPRAAPEYEGCYMLTLSSWEPAMDLGEDSVFSTPPAAIELTGTRGTSFFEKKGFLVKPALGAKASIHHFAYWFVTPSDQIEVIWTTGFSGLFMELTRKEADLIGRAETFWDFPRNSQKAEVRGKKIPCGEKPPSVAN